MLNHHLKKLLIGLRKNKKDLLILDLQKLKDYGKKEKQI